MPDDSRWNEYSDAVFHDVTQHLAREIALVLQAEAECGDDLCGGMGGIVTNLDDVGPDR